MPYLASIFIYPIKALDGVAVTQTTVLTSGALAHDREFALFDNQEKFVNGKRNAKVHLLRTSFSPDFQTISLGLEGTGTKQTFHLNANLTPLESWLSNYFGMPIHVQQNQATGFPDDTIANGPTVLSTKTIETVSSWFSGITPEQMRLRLRANLELADVPAFWEDQLFTEADRVVQFQIGDVLVEGVNPCQRCVVPARDTWTGEFYPNFQKTFITRRKEMLPDWTTNSRFNHYYRLSVNTRIPSSEAGKVLQIGDEVQIIGTRQR